MSRKRKLMEDVDRVPMCTVITQSSWHDPVRCALSEGHPGDHSWASLPQFDPVAALVVARTVLQEEADRSTRLQEEVAVAQQERDDWQRLHDELARWEFVGDPVADRRVRVLEEALREIEALDPLDEHCDIARTVLAGVPVPVETRAECEKG